MHLTRMAILGFAVAAGSAAQPAFDVASVKLADRSRPSHPFHIGQDGLTTQGALKHLIMQAYEFEDYQVTGGPPWVESESYDVEAKAPGRATPAQIRAMLRTLLAERFHLQLKRETRTMNGFILSVDKNGPKLPAPRTDVPADSAGVIQMGGGEMWARASTMQNLARGLRFELESPVLDRTGIPGHYDFKLRFEEGNRDLAGDADRASGGAAQGTPGTVFSALRELGLRLDPGRLPIEVLIVDRAEKPTEN